MAFLESEMAEVSAREREGEGEREMSIKLGADRIPARKLGTPKGSDYVVNILECMGYRCIRMSTDMMWFQVGKQIPFNHHHF